MKQNTGWNCFLKQTVLKKINTKVNAVGLFPFKEVLYQDIEEMDNKCTHTHVHTHEHTHTALLEPIKSHLINVLIKLNSTIYLREEKRGETSSHAISLIVPSESEMPVYDRRS